jgi:hypothetical protein
VGWVAGARERPFVDEVDGAPTVLRQDGRRGGRSFANVSVDDVFPEGYIFDTKTFDFPRLIWATCAVKRKRTSSSTGASLP